VRRVRPAMLNGTDFSSCRGVIVGGDLLRAHSFDAFHQLLGPHGLSPDALLPAYGLAEATLAVSAHRIGERWRAVNVDAASIVMEQSIAKDNSRPDRRMTVVGCGRPVAGVS